MRNRELLKQAFQETKDDTGALRNKATIDFIIGTPKTMGTGLTLTRAFRIVLMEPDWTTSVEEQGIGRIRRFCQRNPITYSYRLINLNSAIEQAILKRQNRRSKFANATLNAADTRQHEGNGKTVIELD